MTTTPIRVPVGPFTVSFSNTNKPVSINCVTLGKPVAKITFKKAARGYQEEKLARAFVDGLVGNMNTSDFAPSYHAPSEWQFEIRGHKSKKKIPLVPEEEKEVNKITICQHGKKTFAEILVKDQGTAAVATALNSYLPILTKIEHSINNTTQDLACG